MTQKVDTWFDDTVMLACDTVSAELLEKNFEAQFLRAEPHRSNEKEKDLALASPLLVCIGLQRVPPTNSQPVSGFKT